jgi:hypothetical protein
MLFSTEPISTEPISSKPGLPAEPDLPAECHRLTLPARSACIIRRR